LAALYLAGVTLEDKPNLSACISDDFLQRAFMFMVARNGGKTSSAIGTTAYHVRTLALFHCGAAERIPKFLTIALPRLHARQGGLTEKNKRSMRQFDDPKVVRRLLEAPSSLWRRAGTSAGVVARLTAEASIAIEILIHAPIRIQNLRTIRLDRHMRYADGDLFLCFTSEEVKNYKALEMRLPQAVANRVREYISRYRRPEDPSNPYLFPGDKDQPKHRSTIAKQITKHLFEVSGVTLTPHQFRHAAAKILLDRRPGIYEVVRQLLGHSSTSTVYEHYSGAETDAAVGLYVDIITRTRLGEDETDANPPPFMVRIDHAREFGRRSAAPNRRGRK
jgi:integrase